MAYLKVNEFLNHLRIYLSSNKIFMPAPKEGKTHVRTQTF